ncbi:MAG: SagB family peptide dehydrogenase [Chloroflexi bacterium]|nr:SagB family peptide dehydrogenase [Chloroflexota bacterium]
MRSSTRTLDWPNQPLPFKIYTSLAPMPLSLTFDVSSPPTGEIDLNSVARLAYFSNGVTRVLHGVAFRAAACTGALFHIEVYCVAGDVDELEAGVYHYGAHDNALRQLRRGDFRQVLIDASGQEPRVAGAPLTLVLTSTWWRNAWKYEARAYRHAFWDAGTLLANLLSVADGQGLPARLIVGFADSPVNQLLDVDPDQEAAIALVAIGRDAAPPRDSPPTPPLNLPTRPLSAHQVAYPQITAAHAASSLPDGAAAAGWRARFPVRREARRPITDEPVEAVILRRGSSRRFSQAAITLDGLRTLLARATCAFDCDAFVACDLYLIVNAVDDLQPGAYAYSRDTRTLELLKPGDHRPMATYLDLGQPLAGDAAFNAYWLVNLDVLDNRGYRAAQLSAAIEAGQLYLAAYGLGLGATGLTFFDDDVTRFFEPHASGKSVMFLTAVGHPFRR